MGAASLSAPLVAADPAVHQAQSEARIDTVPRIVRGSDGENHLAYEMRITSFQSEQDPIRLVKLAIFDGAGARPLKVVEGAGLYSLLARSAREDGPKDGVRIASGQSRTLFLWLTLPTGARPEFLRHQLTFRTENGVIQRADDVRAQVAEAAPIRIAAPLRGGRWLAAEGPGNPYSHHWGSMVAIDGRLTDPQRFAIDWFGLDEGDRPFRGAGPPATTRDEDWIGYGHEVAAVADGVVVDARDGVANGTPLAPQDVPDDLTNRTLYGNFVVLKIAPGTYAHYAHLKAGSLTVRIGQHVRRGDVIGRLGQTGAAGAPHLHFHISDRPGFEQSEGLPFLFDSFAVRERGIRIEDLLDPTRSSAPPSVATAHRLEMPLDGDVVTFPLSRPAGRRPR